MAPFSAISVGWFMSEEQKRLLMRLLWKAAEELRGKVKAAEYMNYILGFIFYKYLSESMVSFANDLLEGEVDIDGDYRKLAEKVGDSRIGHVKEDAVNDLGFFIHPSQTFEAVLAKGVAKAFILDELKDVFRDIERSTIGKASEEDFANLFHDINLDSVSLHSEPDGRNEIIVKVMEALAGINFGVNDVEADVLGDAYEYLIGNFAAEAGKKAGEFYTPQEVSKVMAAIVSMGKPNLSSVYDPTCGSGSLLLRVARHLPGNSHKRVNFYGQEDTFSTYNLARMNMILHGVPFDHFNIRKGDTLKNPLHSGKKFDAIVANPPFSLKWAGDEMTDLEGRFTRQGGFVAKSKADWAFIQHMTHHLEETGVMAVVVPMGVLFRGNSEGQVRRWYIESANMIDAVIGLPANLFFGTGIPAAIVVFKKCREDSGNILFIDASREFECGKQQNKLRVEDVERIVAAYKNRSATEKYSALVPIDKVRENDFNLNISRYIENFEAAGEIDLEALIKEEESLAAEFAAHEAKMNHYLKELGYVAA